MFAVVMGLCATSAFAEEKAAATAPKEEKITFDQHIVPIFREKCGSCHNANDKKGDLVLDNYNLAMQGGASGEVVRTDGDASQSQLYLVVTHKSEPVMPPSQPKLPDEQLTLIRKWIEGGALENAGSKAKPKKNMAVAKVEVSNARPAGPPPMPENLPIDPLLVSARGNGVTALANNPWSSVAAVAGHKQVFLYDTKTLELAGVLPFPEGVAHILKFSRNGQLLMAGGGRGSHSGKVVVWDVKTGKRIAEVGSEYDVVLAADISPDQTQIALGGAVERLPFAGAVVPVQSKHLHAFSHEFMDRILTNPARCVVRNAKPGTAFVLTAAARIGVPIHRRKISNLRSRRYRHQRRHVPPQVK